MHDSIVTLSDPGQAIAIGAGGAFRRLKDTLSR